MNLITSIVQQKGLDKKHNYTASLTMRHPVSPYIILEDYDRWDYDDVAGPATGSRVQPHTQNKKARCNERTEIETTFIQIHYYTNQFVQASGLFSSQASCDQAALEL